MLPDLFYGKLLKREVRDRVLQTLQAAGLKKADFSCYMVGPLVTEHFREFDPMQFVITLSKQSAAEFNEQIGKYLTGIEFPELKRKVEFAFQNGVLDLESHPAVYDVQHGCWFKGEPASEPEIRAAQRTTTLPDGTKILDTEADRPQAKLQSVTVSLPATGPLSAGNYGQSVVPPQEFVETLKRHFPYFLRLDEVKQPTSFQQTTTEVQLTTYASKMPELTKAIQSYWQLVGQKASAPKQRDWSAAEVQSMQVTLPTGLQQAQLEQFLRGEGFNRFIATQSGTKRVKFEVYAQDAARLKQLVEFFLQEEGPPQPVAPQADMQVSFSGYPKERIEQILRQLAEIKLIPTQAANGYWTFHVPANQRGQLETTLRQRFPKVRIAGRRYASAFISDIRFGDLPRDTQKDVLQFQKCKADDLIPSYGMVVSELLPKADPHNLESAREHVKGTAKKTLEREIYDKSETKFLLLTNDRLIDGHHYLAKAERAGVTRTLRVLDLTPLRFQKRKGQADWTKATGTAFVDKWSPAFKKLGFELSLIGSVATKGSSDHDLDVLVKQKKSGADEDELLALIDRTGSDPLEHGPQQIVVTTKQGDVEFWIEYLPGGELKRLLRRYDYPLVEPFLTGANQFLRKHSKDVLEDCLGDSPSLIPGRPVANTPAEFAAQLGEIAARSKARRDKLSGLFGTHEEWLASMEKRKAGNASPFIRFYAEHQRGYDPDHATVEECLMILERYYREYLTWYDRRPARDAENQRVYNAFTSRLKELQVALQSDDPKRRNIAVDNGINEWHLDYPVVLHLMMEEESTADEPDAERPDWNALLDILYKLGRISKPSPHRHAGYFGKNYWMDPNCKLIPVDEHFDYLPTILGVPREELDRDNVDRSVYRKKVKHDNPMADAYLKGWLRVVDDRNGTLHASGKATARQLKALKDFALEHELTFQFDRVGREAGEAIRQVAVRLGQHIYSGGRTHSECFRYASDQGADTQLERADGFLTSTGRFVERPEAYRLAQAAGQTWSSVEDRLLHSYNVREATLTYGLRKRIAVFTQGDTIEARKEDLLEQLQQLLSDIGNASEEEQGIEPGIVAEAIKIANTVRFRDPEDVETLAAIIFDCEGSQSPTHFRWLMDHIKQDLAAFIAARGSLGTGWKWKGALSNRKAGLREDVLVAVGEASTCWDNLEGAGVFDSEHAIQVADKLLHKIQLSNRQSTKKHGQADPPADLLQELGVRYDGVFMGKLWQLTDYNEGTPAFGATFAVPVGSTPEAIRTKHQQVKQSFGRVALSNRQAQQFTGAWESWLDPDGKMHDIRPYETHADWALDNVLPDDFREAYEPDDTSDWGVKIDQAMQERGYVRIQASGPDLYAGVPQGKLNRRQLQAIRDYVLEHDLSEARDDNGRTIFKPEPRQGSLERAA